MCISWTVKYLILLMHGATMKHSDISKAFSFRFITSLLIAFVSVTGPVVKYAFGKCKNLIRKRKG